MNEREKGFLLLTSHLGNPQRRPLSVAQFRNLAVRVSQSECPEGEKLKEEHLIPLGYGREEARRIVSLLEEEELLERYLLQGKKNGCVPITRVSAEYPLLLRKRLGLMAPGCLWAKGDLGLLSIPGISLVGSRNIQPDNRNFAAEVGRQAALQGYALISGNARGADQTAQHACLAGGGKVISVIADSLADKTPRENVLYLSEESFDAPFSTVRALSRNVIIHCTGLQTFVAQCSLGKGGSWDGSVKNLKNHWSPLFAYQDGSEAMAHLMQMGATEINTAALCDFSRLSSDILSLFA